ncbi:putative nicotianamine synthase [Podospora aff. communis PSN243]|uniref:Nicotianamine synthase n=1 Tax=Podospora aff. communis PSN243 TaxID=3040156 RepID=A0AAV9GV00_9PEZI|nr:putative nicotianamine synthase [Podospora aff. communis PSN243]
MSFLLSWLGLRARQPREAARPHCLPSPPETPDSLSVIDKDEAMEDSKMIDLSKTAKRISQQILETHAALLTLPDFYPSQKINSLLGALVPLCCETHDHRVVSQVLENPDIERILPALRRICSQSESCLESYWADRIMSLGTNPESCYEALMSFPYYENYEQLAWFELQALRTAKKPKDPVPLKCAFLGSGPLPLSSICLLEQLQQVSGAKAQVEIYNVDMDGEAIRRSKDLIDKLSYKADGMYFIHGCAGSDEIDLGSMDVINLAALAGETQAEKEHIIINVAKQMKIGAILVVRSARGLRTVLYPEFDAQHDSCKEIRQILQPLTELHPMNHVVNSAIIFRKFDPAVGPEGYYSTRNPVGK